MAEPSACVWMVEAKQFTLISHPAFSGKVHSFCDEICEMAKLNFGSLTFFILASLGGNVFADEHGHQHHRFAKDVDAFHAVLAPVWHARPGPERTQDACAKSGDMARLAKDIRSADASQLSASIAVLATKCEGKADVDAAFYDVHEAFHRLIDAKPASAKR